MYSPAEIKVFPPEQPEVRVGKGPTFRCPSCGRRTLVSDLKPWTCCAINFLTLRQVSGLGAELQRTLAEIGPDEEED